MNIIENKSALLTTDNSTVYVVDAYGFFPEALVMDEDGHEFFVRYHDLKQDPIEETKSEKEDRRLQEEKSLARCGRY
jgi:hypothetical protein